MFNIIEWIKKAETKEQKLNRIALLVLALGAGLWSFASFFSGFFHGFSTLLVVGAFTFLIGIIIYAFAQFIELRER
jgi:predicted membrane channel-forming protein YqfA (hemolysin III family)